MALTLRALRVGLVRKLSVQDGKLPKELTIFSATRRGSSRRNLL